MNKASVLTGFTSLVHNRHLLWTLIARDVRSKYRETIFGYWWLIIYPVLMLSVYSFIFGGIFQSRWLNQGGMADFVMMLYCGLILFGIFSDTITRATSAIRGQPNFVKKVVFPLELLPVIIVGSSTYSALVGLGILIIMIVASKFSLPLTTLYLPFVFIPFIVLVSGLAWALASLGVFFPDMTQLVSVLTTVLLFLSPVFFPLESVPSIVKPFMMFNPLTFPIEQTRELLILGQQPDWTGIGLYSTGAIIVACSGLWFFQSSRRAFADVI